MTPQHDHTRERKNPEKALAQEQENASLLSDEKTFCFLFCVGSLLLQHGALIDMRSTSEKIPLMHIPSLDGSKGTFVPCSKERWVCESQICIAKAGKGSQKDMKKMGL